MTQPPHSKSPVSRRNAPSHQRQPPNSQPEEDNDDDEADDTFTDIPRGGMRAPAVSHIPLAVHLVVKVPALRPLSGVPFHAHQNRLVSPVHSPMPMDRYITRPTSSSRAAVVSTVLVQTAAAQASIAQDL